MAPPKKNQPEGSKLTEADLRDVLENKATAREVAERRGVTTQAVYGQLKRWKTRLAGEPKPQE